MLVTAWPIFTTKIIRPYRYGPYVYIYVFQYSDTYIIYADKNTNTFSYFESGYENEYIYVLICTYCNTMQKYVYGIDNRK